MAAGSPETTWRQAAELFEVLSYPNRLELLAKLREPHTINDIDLSPSRENGDGNPGRTLSRQGIRYHLNKLADAGFIQVGRGAGSRQPNDYTVDRGRLYAMSEALREMAASSELPPFEGSLPQLGQLSHAGNNGGARGPHLVMVHGLRPGHVFDLSDLRPDQRRGWRLGRAPDADLHLDGDPFAAPQQAEVLRTNQGFELVDLGGSREPTYLNWEKMAPGKREELTLGDLIGVGRSLLLFRT